MGGRCGFQLEALECHLGGKRKVGTKTRHVAEASRIELTRPCESSALKVEAAIYWPRRVTSPGPLFSGLQCAQPKPNLMRPFSDSPNGTNLAL